MLKELMKMKEQKMAGKALAPEYKEAKGGILKDLIKEMTDMAGGDIKDGMKKITVAAPDAESLHAGLSKAEEMLPESEEDEDAECAECAAGEHGPEMHMEEESPEALKMKIKELEAQLAAKGN